MKKKNGRPLPPAVRRILADPLNGILILDSSNRILAVNSVFLARTEYTEKDLLGKRLDRVIKPYMAKNRSDLDAFLKSGQGLFSPWQIIIRQPRDGFNYPPEVQGGFIGRLCLEPLGKGLKAARFQISSYSVTRQKGHLSTDMLVTLDEKGRILEASENFSNALNRTFREVYQHPIGAFLSRPRPWKPAGIQKRAAENLRKLADKSNRPWDKAVECDFSEKDWKKHWNVCFAGKPSLDPGGGLRITSSGTNVYLIYKQLLDPAKWDLAWEIEMEISGRSGFAVFFHGWNSGQKFTAAAPNQYGYSLGSYFYGDAGNEYSTVRVRRDFQEMAMRHFNGPLGRGRCRLRAEKSGGCFRLSINKRKLVEYVDPQFKRYSRKKFTGLILTSFPAVLYRATLFTRPANSAYADFAIPEYDVALKTQPEETFEAELLEREVMGRKVINVYFRNVTMLRRIEREKDEALQAERKARKEKDRALKQITEELVMAGHILNRLLPREFPAMERLRFSSFYKPSGAVGGDLFDVFQADKDNVAILMYDVSGHGVPAALVSVMTKAIFQKIFHAGTPLLDLMKAMNQELLYHDLGRDIPGGSFVTIFLALLEPATGTLRYIGAGFTPPLLLKDKEVALLETRGVPLGMQADLNSREMELKLNRGTKLLCYTDGLYEIFNSKGEFYGRERLQGFIKERAGLPLDKLMEALKKYYEEYTLDMPPQDDVSVLGIEFLA